MKVSSVIKGVLKVLILLWFMIATSNGFISLCAPHCKKVKEVKSSTEENGSRRNMMKPQKKMAQKRNIIKTI
jgi:phage FluMu protein Com